MSKIWKIADDSKICSRVVDDTDAEVVQTDLRNLFKWSEDWQMLFNIDKCIVLHMGGGGGKNQTQRYELGGKELKSVEQERETWEL